MPIQLNISSDEEETPDNLLAKRKKFEKQSKLKGKSVVQDYEER